jgi:Flp pilus assembly CpaE family ATPase
MQRATNGHARAHAPHKVHVIGIHSDRGGAGKTTLAANLAYVVGHTGARGERIARHFIPNEDRAESAA